MQAASESNSAGVTLLAPAEIDFQWSDGQTEVTKRLKFDRSYIAEVEVSVRHNGQPVPHRVAWRGGFGDATENSALGNQHALYYDAANSKLNTVATRKGVNKKASAA